MAENTEADKLAHWRWALTAAVIPAAQYQIAQQITEEGTPEAFELLSEQVVEGRAAREACLGALHQAGAQARLAVLSALGRHPDCWRLVVCLAGATEPEIAQALLEACRRTTSLRTVRFATELLAREALECLRELSEVIQARGSERMKQAWILGVAATDPEKYADRLTPLFASEADESLQNLVFSIPQVRNWPEAHECLRRQLKSQKVRHRWQALGVIAAGRLQAFTGEALERWIRDSSPSVRWEAWEALRALVENLGEPLSRLGEEVCGELATTAEQLTQQLSADRGSEEAELQPLEDSVEALYRLCWAAPVAGEAGPTVAGKVFAALRRASSPLAVLCSAEPVPEPLCAVTEKLLELELQLVRAFWSQGEPKVRWLAWELWGQCTVAAKGRLPEAPADDKFLSWDELLQDLAGLAEELYHRAEAAWQGQPWPEDPLGDWPWTGLQATRLATLSRVLEAGQRIAGSERKALQALEASLFRERQAAERTGEGQDQESLAAAQEAYNDRALILLQPEHLALAWAISTRPKGEEAQAGPSLPSAAETFCEQNLQLALLGIVSQVLSPEAIPLLLRCLRSANVLVAESAQRLVVRLGDSALPALKDALDKATDARHRAELLELGRCLQPQAVLKPARQSLESDEPRLRAVAAKVLGEAGSLKDTQRLQQPWADSELAEVCRLQALGKLAPHAHVEVFKEALGSPYPGVREAAAHALASCDPKTVHQAARELRGSANAFQRLAGRQLVDAEGNICRPFGQFWGRPLPVEGDCHLGARLASSGEGPWQWGLPVFLDREQWHPEAYAELLASEEELAEGWESLCQGESHPHHLLPRLREIALTGDTTSSHQAWAWLRDWFSPDLSSRGPACLEYCGLPLTEATADQAAGAFCRAVEQCTPQQVASLTLPNPSLSNPLAEAMALPPTAKDYSLRFGSALVLLYQKLLPQELGIEPLSLPPVTAAEERRAALEAEWEKLRGFQDPLYGFLVRPRLNWQDLGWYCKQEPAGERLRWEMIDYLVASVSVLPQLPEDRAEILEVVEEIFSPLLRKTQWHLKRAGQPDSEEWAEWLVEEEFWRAVAEFDPFWAQRPAALFPFGNLSQMAEPSAQSPGLAKGLVPDRYLPFPHFLQQRLEGLVSRHQAESRRQPTREPEHQDTRWHYAPPDELVTLHRHQEEALAEGIDQAKSADELVEAWNRVTERPEDISTVNLESEGKLVPCVDIETLAGLVGSTLNALRKREQRGDVHFLRHQGRRYLPVDQIPDLQARLVPDVKLAEQLGVVRQTIARWKQEAPAGLGPRQLLEYLGRRAQVSQADDGEGGQQSD